MAPPRAGGEGPPARRAYPAGKKLSTNEMRQSAQHAPWDKNGTMICWDTCTWVGCSRGANACAHRHEPSKGLKGLHWTTVAQLLRRGGLRSGPRWLPATRMPPCPGRH